MDGERVRIWTIVSELFGQNSYVAATPDRDDCLVVDPGFDTATLIERLQSNHLTPAAVLVTHGHADHIAGIASMKSHWPNCPIIAGKNEADKLTDPKLNLSHDFGFPIASPAADILVADGETLSAAGMDLRVREIPGHSSGHVVFIVETGSPWRVFVGDVIFSGSVGRTDFPDGSFESLAAGIRAKLYTLPDETMLLPGHGPVTTVGREKTSNPFVRGNP
ncbi:MAG: MBL fold metallo-hydrolase [Thermogutta sp.]